MIECRALERIEINQLAMLHLDGVPGVYPCMVMNFHNQGARLHSPRFHTVAFEFDLSFDGFKTTKHCHVPTLIHINRGIPADPIRSIAPILAIFAYGDTHFAALLLLLRARRIRWTE
jgi:hypothetical protein